MKKGLILYSLSIIAIMSFFSFSYNNTTSKCVKLTCGKKVTYELVSGADEIEIASTLKTNYPTCTFEYVSKKKCKKP
jgi:hypothetical protein